MIKYNSDNSDDQNNKNCNNSNNLNLKTFNWYLQKLRQFSGLSLDLGQS